MGSVIVVSSESWIFTGLFDSIKSWLPPLSAKYKSKFGNVFWVRANATVCCNNQHVGRQNSQHYRGHRKVGHVGHERGPPARLHCQSVGKKTRKGENHNGDTIWRRRSRCTIRESCGGQRRYHGRSSCARPV